MTGFPILAKATERMSMRYKRHLRGLDKENANPFSLVIASIDPDSLSLLFQGLYSGAASRISSVSKRGGSATTALSPIRFHDPPLKLTQALLLLFGFKYTQARWLTLRCGGAAGLVGCIASVVSPFAGATGIGLAIGSTVDEHLQALVPPDFLPALISQTVALPCGSRPAPASQIATRSFHLAPLPFHSPHLILPRPAPARAAARAGPCL